MSHADTIATLPEDYKIIRINSDVKVGAFRIIGENTWGIQFHPEVYHTLKEHRCFKILLSIFVDVLQDWTPDSFAESTIS